MCSDYEPVDMIATYLRKARKEHACRECSRTIGVGESYYQSAYKFEGGFYSERTCLHCMVIPGHWMAEHCAGYGYEMLYAESVEHWQEECRVRRDCRKYKDTFQGLDPELKAGVKGMARKWRRADGSLMPLPSDWQGRMRRWMQ